MFLLSNVKQTTSQNVYILYESLAGNQRNSAKQFSGKQISEHRKVMLSKIGYQPNCHLMYISSSWFAAQFCLADKFDKQYFWLSS